MLSDYFEAPWRLARMRATCVGPYIDGFSTILTDAGYSPFTSRGYLRAADHVGRWADLRGIDIRSWDDDLLVRFGRHLPRCRCINKGIFRDALAGVRLLLAHLRAVGVIAAAEPTLPSSKYAQISDRFADWMRRHRGVVPSTTARYQRVLQPFLESLGEDPRRYTVAAIRAYVIDQFGDVGPGETRSAVKAIRAFLRSSPRVAFTPASSIAFRRYRNGGSRRCPATSRPRTSSAS